MSDTCSETARLLAALLTEHQVRLRAMVDLRLDDRLRARLDPSDVLQEAFREAARRLDEFVLKRPMPFFLWLRRITGQKLVDLHRRHLAGKRDVRLEVSIDVCVGAAPSPSSITMADRLVGKGREPDDLAASRETRDRARAALDSLPPADREVLALRHFEQLTNSEVAATLGISEDAASQRHVRALKRLRRALESPPGGIDDWS